MLGQDTPDLAEEIPQQRIGIREIVRSSFIDVRPVPMVGGGRALLERRADARDTVRIVKPNQALSVRFVKRRRITQPVRPLGRRLARPDLEFQPIALIEPMGTTVKGEEKFERVFIGVIQLSYHHMII